MKCRECGSEIEGNTRFCYICGAKLDSKVNEQGREVKADIKTQGTIKTSAALKPAANVKPSEGINARTGAKPPEGINAVNSASGLRWCKICGAKLEGRTSFCYICGAKLSTDLTGQKSEPIGILRDQTGQKQDQTKQEQSRIGQKQNQTEAEQAKKITAPGMIKCRSCGAELPESTRFCFICGTQISARVAGNDIRLQPAVRPQHKPRVKPDKIKCTRCGRELGADKIFCSDCGMKQYHFVEKKQRSGELLMTIKNVKYKKRLAFMTTGTLNIYDNKIVYTPMNASDRIELKMPALSSCTAATHSDGTKGFRFVTKAAETYCFYVQNKYYDFLPYTLELLDDYISDQS